MVASVASEESCQSDFSLLWITRLDPWRLNVVAVEEGGQLAGVVLEVAEVVEVELRAAEGEAWEAGWACEGGGGFGGEGVAGGGEAEVEVCEQFWLREVAAGVFAVNVGEAGGVECGVGLPGFLRGGEIAVGAVEDVIGNEPEGVLGDWCVPEFGGASTHAVAEHGEGGFELAEEGVGEGVCGWGHGGVLARRGEDGSVGE